MSTVVFRGDYLLSNAILDTVIVQVLRQLVHDAYRVSLQLIGNLVG